MDGLPKIASQKISDSHNMTNENSANPKEKIKENLTSESNQQPTVSSSQQTEDLEEIQEFAKTFKQRREKLGLTLEAVGVSMGKMYGTEFTKQYISRFETSKLSFKNMCKLKPLLQKWLKDVDDIRKTPCSTKKLRSNTLEFIIRQEKLRTTIDSTSRKALEQFFTQNPKPTTEELANLAKSLDMETRVLRVWFCNRRHKAKRMNAAAVNSLAINLPGKIEMVSVASTPTDNGQ